MDLPPPHVLAQLDALIVGQESIVAINGDLQTVDDDDDRSVSSEALGISSSATSFTEDGTGTTSSRFWGVTWGRPGKEWRAAYHDAAGKTCHVGYFDDEEEAARAVNKAISDAGLEGRRHVNAVDATGALVPRERTYGRDRSAVVAPDPARAPTEATSKYWGVSWNKSARLWEACYTDANGKKRTIGKYVTQEAAAHAVNAGIRRAGLEGRRKTNPVVDGQLVPRALKAHGHGWRSQKRRREESAAAMPSSPPPARRARRVVNYAEDAEDDSGGDDSEPDDSD